MPLHERALQLINEIPGDLQTIVGFAEDPQSVPEVLTDAAIRLFTDVVPGGVGELLTGSGGGEVVPRPLSQTTITDLSGRPSSTGAIDITGFGGGNGKTATRTIVETLDLATLRITSRKIMEGSPKLMNKDVAAMRKVLKISAALRKSTPRVATRPSKTTELKNAILNKAIAGASGCAPDPCC